MKLEIITANETKLVQLDAPILLSAVLEAQHAKVPMPCGGKQRCKKCRVIANGALSPLTEIEKKALSAVEIDQGIRYACMTMVEGDAQGRIIPTATSEDGNEGNTPALTLEH